MCKLATKDHPWVDVSEWETNQDVFEDFPKVAMEMHYYIKEKFPDKNLEIFYLCGAGIT